MRRIAEPALVARHMEKTAPADMAAHAAAAAKFLRALANPHRLQVLCELAEQELSVSELNSRIPISQSALSQHLKVLRDDELVSTRKDAQTVFYRVARGPALDVIQVLHQHFCADGG